MPIGACSCAEGCERVHRREQAFRHPGCGGARVYSAHQCVEHDAVNVLCVAAHVGPKLEGDTLRAYIAARVFAAKHFDRHPGQSSATWRPSKPAPAPLDPPHPADRASLGPVGAFMRFSALFPADGR